MQQKVRQNNQRDTDEYSSNKELNKRKVHCKDHYFELIISIH